MAGRSRFLSRIRASAADVGRGGRSAGRDAAGRTTGRVVGSTLAVAVMLSIVGITGGSGRTPAAAGLERRFSAGPGAADQTLPPVPLDECVDTDNGAPVLNEVQLSPPRLVLRHQPRRVSVRARADDVGGPGPASGVAAVEVFLQQAAGRGDFDERSASVKLRHRPDGSWTGSVLIWPGMSPGRWIVGDVSVRDRAGISAGFHSRALARLGPIAAFTVVGPVDHEPPRLLSLTLSRTHLTEHPGHGGSVRVTARATDDVGVFGVFVGYRRTDVHDKFASLRPTRNGTWVGRLRFPRWNRHLTYRLQAQVVDGPDSFTVYGAKLFPLSDEGIVGPIPGPGEVTVSGRLDHHHPTGVFTLVSPPKPIDVRTTDAVLTVRMRMRDPESGVDRATVTFDLGEEKASFRRISGNRHDGVWEARIRVDHCDPPFDVHDLQATLFDRTDRVILLEDHRVVQFISDTARFPRVDFDAFEPTRTSLRFTWESDVVGITEASAPIFPTRRFFAGIGHRGTPVDGTWACQTSTGAPVDCYLGPVRVSTFTPAGPLTGNNYVLGPNAEGSGTLAVSSPTGRAAGRFDYFEIGLR